VSVLLLHNVPQLDMVASNSYIISFKFKVNSSSDLLPPGLSLFILPERVLDAGKNYGCCILAAYLNLVTSSSTLASVRRDADFHSLYDDWHLPF